MLTFQITTEIQNDIVQKLLFPFIELVTKQQQKNYVL